MASEGLLMEFSDLSRSLGADLLSFADSDRVGFSSVSIDSRLSGDGTLFVALAGTVNDGHSFVKEAFGKGAAAALVERKKLTSFDLPRIAESYGGVLVVVDDTLKGFQQAATEYLKKFPRLLKIGITGSSGKTTTKEIAAAVISAEKCTVTNPGNYNSETGLPLVVFSVRPCHEVGIFEMGMNKKGEISALASVLKPNIAIITNIGSSHIGYIGSKEAIAKEKKDIFLYFDENCTALIPEDSAFRDFLADGVSGKVIFYGEKSFSQLAGVKSLGLDGYEIKWNGDYVRFALPGRHSLADAFAALAIAREIPVTDAAIKQGLESVKPLFGRGEILRGRVTVIRDCYNANPESLAAALEFCESLDLSGSPGLPSRLVYVIGEMLELGVNSVQAHENIGRFLLGSKADMIFLYGKETAVTASILNTFSEGKNNGSGQERFFHTCDIDDLARALSGYVCDGDTVLLKGSRGCALEQLTDIFTGSHNRQVDEGVAATRGIAATQGVA